MSGGLFRRGLRSDRSHIDVICGEKIGLIESRGIRLGNSRRPRFSRLLFDEALQFGDNLGTIITSGRELPQFSHPFSHRPNTCSYDWAFGTRMWGRLFADITLHSLCCFLVFGCFRLRAFFSHLSRLGSWRIGIVRRTRKFFRSSGNWRGWGGRDLNGRF